MSTLKRVRRGSEGVLGEAQALIKCTLWRDSDVDDDDRNEMETLMRCRGVMGLRSVWHSDVYGMSKVVKG
jgi:hypothetical protein